MILVKNWNALKLGKSTDTEIHPNLGLLSHILFRANDLQRLKATAQKITPGVPKGSGIGLQWIQ